MAIDEQAIQATGDLLQRYALAIIIAPRPSVGLEPFRQASGILIAIDRKHFLVTAHHVVERDFKQIERVEPRVLLHLGATQFKPKDRLVHVDADADVAFLDVTQHEAEAVGSWIYDSTTWPPETPGLGAMVGIAGYPKVIRMREGPKKWKFNAFVTQTPLSSVNERQLSCAFKREEWVE